MQFTLAQLERLIEQGSGHETSRYQNGHDTSRGVPLAPSHIRDRVYKVVSKADGGVNRADIAKALQVKKTPWLINAIESLVEDQFLARSQSTRSNGVVMYWYSVRPD